MKQLDVIHNTVLQRCKHEMGLFFRDADFKEFISNYLADIKRRYEDLTFAKNFQKICPLTGALQNDYNIKIIELSGNDFVLSSLRFISLNPQESFIFIDFSTVEIVQENMASILEKVSHYYSHLNVNRYSFLSKYPALLNNKGLPLKHDKIWVKGLITIARPFSDNVTTIRVVKTNHLSAEEYAIYKKEFDALINERPNLKGELKLEKFDYLNELGAMDFLFKVVIDNIFAGIICVDKSFEYTCYGLEIVEEFLFKAYRGKGYGKIIQRKLMDELAVLGGEEYYLLGSISAKNIASLNTAQANNRMPFLYSYFANINTV